MEEAGRLERLVAAGAHAQPLDPLQRLASAAGGKLWEPHAEHAPQSDHSGSPR